MARIFQCTVKVLDDQVETSMVIDFKVGMLTVRTVRALDCQAGSAVRFATCCVDRKHVK